MEVRCRVRKRQRGIDRKVCEREKERKRDRERDKEKFTKVDRGNERNQWHRSNEGYKERMFQWRVQRKNVPMKGTTKECSNKGYNERMFQWRVQRKNVPMKGTTKECEYKCNLSAPDVISRWTSKFAPWKSVIMFARRLSNGVSDRVEVKTMDLTTSTNRSTLFNLIIWELMLDAINCCIFK